jgi:hypothetical protein
MIDHINLTVNFLNINYTITMMHQSNSTLNTAKQPWTLSQSHSTRNLKPAFSSRLSNSSNQKAYYNYGIQSPNSIIQRNSSSSSLINNKSVKKSQVNND